MKDVVVDRFGDDLDWIETFSAKVAIYQNGRWLFKDGIWRYKDASAAGRHPRSSLRGKVGGYSGETGRICLGR